MKDELIRDFHGRIIGQLAYKPNGDIEVKDSHNRILGYYIKNRNVTTDFYNRIVAQGNAVGMLLRG